MAFSTLPTMARLQDIIIVEELMMMDDDLHSIRARSALLKEFLNDSAEDDDSSRLPASSRPRSRRRERSLFLSLSVRCATRLSTKENLHMGRNPKFIKEEEEEEKCFRSFIFRSFSLVFVGLAEDDEVERGGR